MNGSATKEARRDIRRAFGPDALAKLDQMLYDIQQTNRHVTQLRLVVGRHTDSDTVNPILTRLKTYEEGLLALAEAWKTRLDAEIERDRSIWTRLRWLIRGPKTTT